MNAATFLIALRRRATKIRDIRDPLAAAKTFLTNHGDTGEGQALRRVIATLVSGTGEFAESDGWLFSSETLDIVDALVGARIEGVFYSEEEWRDCAGSHQTHLPGRDMGNPGSL